MQSYLLIGILVLSQAVQGAGIEQESLPETAIAQDEINEASVDAELEELSEDYLKEEKDFTIQQNQMGKEAYAKALTEAQVLREKNKQLKVEIAAEANRSKEQAHLTEAAKAKADALNKDLIAGEVEVDRLQKQIDEYNRTQTDLQAKSLEINQKIFEINSKKHALTPEKQELETKYEQLIAEQLKAQEEARLGQIEYEQSMKAAEELRVKNDELAEKIKQEEERAGNNHKMTEDATYHLAELKSKHEQQERDLVELRNQVEFYKQNESALNEKLAKATERLDRVNGKEIKAKVRAKKLKAQYKKKVRELAQLRREIRRIAKMKDRMNNRASKYKLGMQALAEERRQLLAEKLVAEMELKEQKKQASELKKQQKSMVLVNKQIKKQFKRKQAYEKSQAGRAGTINLSSTR